MTHEEVAYHQGQDAAREFLADWMIERGYATGHGDTIADLLKELEWQIEERKQVYSKRTREIALQDAAAERQYD